MNTSYAHYTPLSLWSILPQIIILLVSGYSGTAGDDDIQEFIL